MFKLFLVLFGGVVGATGATAWLLTGTDALRRWQAAPNSALASVQRDVQQALAEGKRRGGEAEERLRRELADYRQGRTPGA